MRELADVIVGTSAEIRAVREYLPKVARSKAPVLITGPTGSGKECVARALHEESPRRRGPFVAINCAALPESLLEAELFGYSKGAFTGAATESPGHIASAAGGTLFLDEIGEMSLSAQARLLRVLETCEVRRLGSSRPVKVDFRVVAATNQALEEQVTRKAFRADLYYRLNVARFELPPLSERREDIPLLAEHLLQELGARAGVLVGAMDEDCVEMLAKHDWPGNVRELRNLVEALLIDPPAGPIRFSDLPLGFRRLLSAQRPAAASERDRLLALLQHAKGNKSEAARRMNWSRMTLYRKLKKHQIPVGDTL